MHTIHRLCQSCIEQNLPQVNVVRGKDGFGFTICSDCPVRVQAVDTGGPAHQSGLCQGDLVLQLNGLPVETWKCVDLAHAIRSSSHIALVVWRGLPELRSGCGAWPRPQTQSLAAGRKLLRQPAHSKHGRRGQRSGFRSSLGALGSLWRDRHEDQEGDHQQEAPEYPADGAALGTVTSSHGDNYIILSPVNTGAQLLQPVYTDRRGTIGRLYQTHPSRGHSLLQEARPGPFSGCTSTLPPPTSSSLAPPTAYANYQNCTVVQSHIPCSSYGTCGTLPPKTLIFPVSVQPLDLCSPDRTLLMAEEMILHLDQNPPAKVTVLIYSDLLLLTREDGAGRCNVLQSPAFLNTLQLTEVPSEPLLLHFLQNSPSEASLFTLESFSIEQKLRVSLCLHDIVHLQPRASDAGHAHRGHALQLSDISSDFGLLSVHQDLLYRPSSPYSTPDPPLLHSYSSICEPIRPPPPLYSPGPPFTCSSPSLSLPPLSPFFSSSPPSRSSTLHPDLQPPPPSSAAQKSAIWKERVGAEEEEEEGMMRRLVVEERQQGEGESASDTSENVGGAWGRGLHLTPFNMHEAEEEEESDEDEHEMDCEGSLSKYRGLHRSLSEGSLLKEPRSPRFLSDSTIHRLTKTMTTLDPDSVSRRPSIDTLRKHLTGEGGTLHHMLLLLTGNKDGDSRNLQLKKKTKTIAADVRSRLAFLGRRRSSRCFHDNSLEKALRNNRPSLKEVQRWAESLEALLTNQYGLAVFRHFLRSEFSEENLDFWLAVEKFKRTRPPSRMATRAAKIYQEFISTSAGRQVNVDSAVRESTSQSLSLGLSPASFQLAQDQIFSLMESDSYPRFLRSRLYNQLANQGRASTATSGDSTRMGANH